MDVVVPTLLFHVVAIALAALGIREMRQRRSGVGTAAMYFLGLLVQAAPTGWSYVQAQEPGKGAMLYLSIWIFIPLGILAAIVWLLVGLGVVVMAKPKG